VTKELAAMSGHGQAGSARKCIKFEDPYYCKDGRGNCVARKSSKGKGHNYKGNISEVQGDMEEGLKWLGTSHR
jgi:hypothetical protein